LTVGRRLALRRHRGKQRCLYLSGSLDLPFPPTLRSMAGDLSGRPTGRSLKWNGSHSRHRVQIVRFFVYRLVQT
jgi:hypothetical protein